MAIFHTRKQEKKVKVAFANGLLLVERDNGRQQVFPLDFFPKLMNATDEEREDWTQTATGIHFNRIDLDVSL